MGVYLWHVALIIGVALAPTDAVAVATLNGKLPKASITTLKAEALINDGTTLVLFALALQVAGGHELALGDCIRNVLLLVPDWNSRWPWPSDGVQISCVRTSANP